MMWTRSSLIRAAFYSVLVPMFFVQLWEAAQKLKDGQPATSISSYSNETVRLPSILICNNRESAKANENSTLVSLYEALQDKEVFSYASYKSHSDENIWYDLENATIVETITGKTLDEVWQPIYIYSFTVHALHKCTILNSFFDVVPSMMGQLHIATNENTYLCFHEKHQMTSGYNRHLGNEPYIKHGDPWTYESIELRQKAVTRLNRPSRPCSPLNNEKFHICLRNYTLRQLGCAPPWEKEALKTMRLCKTRDDFVKFADVTKVFGINEALLDNIIETTGCQVNCKTTKYMAKTFYKLPQSYFSNYTWKRKAKYIFSFTMTEQETEVQAEVVTYDKNNFIADAGGFLGLLLGISAMDAAHVIDRLAGYLFHKSWNKIDNSK